MEKSNNVEMAEKYYSLLKKYDLALQKRLGSPRLDMFDAPKKVKRILRDSRKNSPDAANDVNFDLSSNSQKTMKLEMEIKAILAEIRDFSARAKAQGVSLGLEKLTETFDLNELEWSILAVLFVRETASQNSHGATLKGSYLLRLVAGNTTKSYLKRVVLNEDSSLRKNQLIEGWPTTKSGLTTIFSLSDLGWCWILGEEKPEKEDNSEEEQLLASLSGNNNQKNKSIGDLREPTVKLGSLILPEKTKREINFLITSKLDQERIAKLGLNEGLIKNESKAILFYGPPGTGKTLTAEAIAGELGLKLYIAKTDQVKDMFYGNTPKLLAQLFRNAKQENAVLFLDECETFLSKRSINTSLHERYDSETNILLKEIEEYDGFLVLATNFPELLDKALERRLALRIEFPAPDAETREKIWRAHFTASARLSADVNFPYLAKKFNFSGGYIKNCVTRAARICNHMGAEEITQNILEEAAIWEQNSTLEKEGGRGRPIGFMRLDKTE